MTGLWSGPSTTAKTLADFAVVAHRANLLAERNPAVVVRWLRNEIEARGDHATGIVGLQVTGDALGRLTVAVEPKAA